MKSKKISLLNALKFLTTIKPLQYLVLFSIMLLGFCAFYYMMLSSFMLYRSHLINQVISQKYLIKFICSMLASFYCWAVFTRISLTFAREKEVILKDLYIPIKKLLHFLFVLVYYCMANILFSLLGPFGIIPSYNIKFVLKTAIYCNTNFFDSLKVANDIIYGARFKIFWLDYLAGFFYLGIASLFFLYFESKNSMSMLLITIYIVLLLMIRSLINTHIYIQLLNQEPNDEINNSANMHGNITTSQQYAA